jgi:polynucleotide 5'-kinase involved in rRNA processing
MIIGNKNTGKTTLTKFFKNKFTSKKSKLCVLDVDLGKSLYLPATVSLYIHD